MRPLRRSLSRFPSKNPKTSDQIIYPHDAAVSESACDRHWSEYVAEAVDHLVSAGHHDAVTLAIGRVPPLMRSDVVMDAAIQRYLDASHERLNDTTVTRDDLANQLCEQSPELASRVRLCQSLDQDLTVSRAAASPPTEALAANTVTPTALPRDFGPCWRDGAPRFMLLERLPGGRRSEAFRAVDRARTDRDRTHTVVVKVGAPIADATAFVAESSRLARVESPYVSRVIDAGVWRSQPYIVTEYVNGPSLRAQAEAGPFPLSPSHATELMIDVLQGLMHAHLVGVRHLDIHPGNVVLNASGRAVLVDFELGCGPADKAAPHLGLSPTSDVYVARGAPGFLAPELLVGMASEAGLMKADVYAASGLLLWLLTGQVPNGKTSDEVFSFAEQAVRGSGQDVEAPGLQAVRVDADLRAILHRGLASNPASRYASAGELAEDLRRWRSHEPLWWASPSLTHRAQLAIRRVSGPARATVCALLCFTFALMSLVVTSRIRSLTSERNRALALAAASQSARAAAESEATTGRLVEEQLTVARQFTSILGGLIDSPLTSEGAEWIALFVAARDLSEPLGLDQKLVRAIALRRVQLLDAALRSPSQGEHVVQTPSLEQAIASAARGSWLLEAKEYDDAVAALELAHKTMSALAPPTEPLRERIAWRLSVAKVLRSNGSDSEAVNQLCANAELVRSLPHPTRELIRPFLEEQHPWDR